MRRLDYLVDGPKTAGEIGTKSGGGSRASRRT
jgi:hypothetical protein